MSILRLWLELVGLGLGKCYVHCGHTDIKLSQYGCGGVASENEAMPRYCVIGYTEHSLATV